MPKNEKTSKKVASSAGTLLNRLDAAQWQIGQMLGCLESIGNLLSEARSVAASALIDG